MVVEKRTPVFALFWDFDVALSPGEEPPAEEWWAEVWATLHAHVHAFVCLEDAANVELVVCCSTPQPAGKLGFHAHHPTVCVTPETARACRRALLEALPQAHPSFEKDWDSIVDGESPSSS